MISQLMYSQTPEIHPEIIVFPKNSIDIQQEGGVRLNATSQIFEGYNGNEWVDLSTKNKFVKVISALELQSENSEHANTRYIGSYFTTGSLQRFLSCFELEEGAKVDSIVLYYYDNAEDADIQIFAGSFSVDTSGTVIVNPNEIFKSNGSSIYTQKGVISNLSINGLELSTYYLSVSAIDVNMFHSNWPNNLIQFYRAIIYGSRK